MQSKTIYSNLKPNPVKKVTSQIELAEIAVKTEEPEKNLSMLESPEAEKQGLHVNYLQSQNKQNYFEQSINTASPAKLVEMLYTGALTFLEQAKKAIEEKDMVTASNKIVRVEDIVMELNISLDLDKGLEIGKNLRSLYTYIYKILLDANSKKDLQMLDEAYKYLKELHDIWVEVMKKEPRPPEENRVEKKTLDISL